MDPTQAFNLINAGPYGLATLFALATYWQFKANQDLIKAQKLEIQALNDKIASVLEKTIPLCIQIPDSVKDLQRAIEELDRVTDRCTSGH